MTAPEEVAQDPVKPKRGWRSWLTELLLWALVAITTAVILVLLSERLLPANF